MAASFKTVEPLPSGAHGLVHCLDLAGVSRHDLIHVCGPGALPALLWLCRQGFERAQHLHPGSPRCGAEPADALFVPHLPEVLPGARDLTSVLGPGGWVREEGVLILRTGSRSDAAAAMARLAERGDYGVERRVHDTGHDVLIARRVANAHREAA